MNRKRILALGKLGVLFGLPIALIAGLFGGGVYYGATRRPAIATFERDWLGMDVAVPAPASASTPQANQPAAPPTTPPVDAPAPKPTDAPPAPPPAPSTPAAPLPTAPGPAPAPPPDGDVGPDTKVDALDGDLGARAQLATTIRVKVLVDQALIDRRTDWIDYVQRTVSQASMVYERQFGITLELSAVGRWPVATDGMDSGQLLDDLRARTREESDVLVGMTDRPFDEHVSGKADTPFPDSPYNGAYALVYANNGSTRPHLRTLLHELGHTLGAQDIVDRTSTEWQAKSWMSYAAVSDNEPPWIDSDNRGRILRRKDLPFAPEASPSPAETP